MTTFDPESSIVKAMKGWDDIVPTSACLHCQGTNRAPGDGRTECGFCTPDAEFYVIEGRTNGCSYTTSVRPLGFGFSRAIEAEERIAAAETWVE